MTFLTLKLPLNDFQRISSIPIKISSIQERSKNLHPQKLFIDFAEKSDQPDLTENQSLY